MNNYKYQLEHIFSFGAKLENPPEVIGPVSEGIRVNFYCQGGEVQVQTCRDAVGPLEVIASRFELTVSQYLTFTRLLKAMTEPLLPSLIQE